MPPGVSGLLLKIMLSCDNVVYICLCVSLLPVFWRIKVFIKWSVRPRVRAIVVCIVVFSISSWHAAPTQAQVRLHWTAWRSDLSSVNCRRSCFSCCWSNGVAWPAKRCYVGLVAVGVQEQAEDILVPPLLQNCLTLMTFPSQSLSPLQNSGPCKSVYCLGHFKNVYDDDDNDREFVNVNQHANSLSENYSVYKLLSWHIDTTHYSDCYLCTGIMVGKYY